MFTVLLSSSSSSCRRRAPTFVSAFSRHPVPSKRNYVDKTHKTSLYSTTTDSYYNEETDFPKDVQLSLKAIRKACQITRQVQEETTSSNIEKQTKQDSSPVTIADYAAQAIILQELQKSFPNNNDLFLAEESSSNLKVGRVMMVTITMK